jgi:hypothetical protein
MTRYAGPTDPFPFLDHRTVAETWLPQRGSSHRLGHDPDPESIRPKAQAADRRFARAIAKAKGSFA